MPLRVNISYELDWRKAVKDYPGTGQPGIEYQRDVAAEFGPEAVVEALLLYSSEGALVGVCNYYPNEILVERAGNISVMVAPEYRGRGIGTELLREAVERWPIDFEQQNYTMAGAKLVQRFLEGRGAEKAAASAKVNDPLDTVPAARERRALGLSDNEIAGALGISRERLVAVLDEAGLQLCLKKAAINKASRQKAKARKKGA